MAALPLAGGDEALFGVIGLSYHTPRTFSPSERLFMLTMTQICAQALDHATMSAGERAAREEAEQREAEGEAMLEQMRELQRQKDSFMSAIAHDLRTPLTVVGTTAQLVRRRMKRGEPMEQALLERDLSRIERTVVKMTGMINSMLDLTQLEAGRAPDLRAAPLDLVALAREVAAEHALQTELHHLTVESDAHELVGVWDAVKLERVLENLLTNSIRYSPAGGTITISLHRETSEGEPYAVISVTDQGVGIPADELPRIFDRFYRARNAAAGIPGAGIGLASVRQIIEEHGGTVTVESQVGQGSTFTVRLPLAPPLS